MASSKAVKPKTPSAPAPKITFEAERVTLNMWHVYAVEATEPQECERFPDCNCGVGACKHPAEECIGIVAAVVEEGKLLGWLAYNYSSADLADQRAVRPSAHQAAVDMWGEEAGAQVG
jgi:hypothetical protein